MITTKKFSPKKKKAAATPTPFSRILPARLEVDEEYLIYVDPHDGELRRLVAVYADDGRFYDNVPNLPVHVVPASFALPEVRFIYRMPPISPRPQPKP